MYLHLNNAKTSTKIDNLSSNDEGYDCNNKR